MIIGLTGHTKGFGKYIYDYLIDDHETVFGFSRSNGHNINSQEDREEIVKGAGCCDVFINNTYSRDGQVLLLRMLHDRYPDLRIISVGSDITEIDGCNFKALYINKTKLKKLSTELNTEYKSWGYWGGHPILDIYPELLTVTTIQEAVEELLNQKVKY
jgi:hypothetical protein